MDMMKALLNYAAAVIHYVFHTYGIACEYNIEIKYNKNMYIDGSV